MQTQRGKSKRKGAGKDKRKEEQERARERDKARRREYGTAELSRLPYHTVRHHKDRNKKKK